MLPGSPYADVLVYVRDRLTGVMEREDRGRWMEAALSVHQRAAETLTAFLTRLETAVNELTVNMPESATAELVYFIYREAWLSGRGKPWRRTTCSRTEFATCR